MRLNKIIQRNYTSFSLYYQIKLPLDLEISIPSDDPVRLVSAFVEKMDLSELYKTYGRIRKNQATPRQMLKLVIYAAMNRIYSSRDIRKACKRDINFMYLLEGMPAPDHATIARFISLHFSACAKVLLAQMSDLLYLLGEISGKTIFIDGTKIESAANQYTFVWKQAITKNQARLYTKLTSFVAECEELYGIRTVYHDQISIHTLKRLKKQLCRVKVQEGIVFVHGIGRRKTQLQKSLEQLDQYLEKLKEYTKKLYTLGDRNSYSKTDPDATFMRMKEDAMLNGQLNLITVVLIWKAIYREHGIAEEEISEEIDWLKGQIWSSIETMDRHEGMYDVQDVVRKCFMDQVSKGEIEIRPLLGNSAVDEIKNHILYDDDFYYVTDSTLRTICAPLLATVSFVQLKNEMVKSGMVDCNDGNLKNFTKKKLIWRSYGWQERVRLIWIKKETLMTDEGLLLEDIGEDTKC